MMTLMMFHSVMRLRMLGVLEDHRHDLGAAKKEVTMEQTKGQHQNMKSMVVTPGDRSIDQEKERINLTMPILVIPRCQEANNRLW